MYYGIRKTTPVSCPYLFPVRVRPEAESHVTVGSAAAPGGVWCATWPTPLPLLRNGGCLPCSCLLFSLINSAICKPPALRVGNRHIRWTMTFNYAPAIEAGMGKLNWGGESSFFSLEWLGHVKHNPIPTPHTFPTNMDMCGGPSTLLWLAVISLSRLQSFSFYMVNTLASENANLLASLSCYIRPGLHFEQFLRGTGLLSPKNIQGMVCLTSCFQVGSLKIMALVTPLSLVMGNI